MNGISMGYSWGCEWGYITWIYDIYIYIMYIYIYNIEYGSVYIYIGIYDRWMGMGR